MSSEPSSMDASEPDPLVILRATCRECMWRSGRNRYWIVTDDALRRWPRCPFCGARNPRTRVVGT